MWFICLHFPPFPSSIWMKLWNSYTQRTLRKSCFITSALDPTGRLRLQNLSSWQWLRMKHCPRALRLLTFVLICKYTQWYCTPGTFFVVLWNNTKTNNFCRTRCTNFLHQWSNWRICRCTKLKIIFYGVETRTPYNRTLQTGHCVQTRNFFFWLLYVLVVVSLSGETDSVSYLEPVSGWYHWYARIKKISLDNPE